MLKGLARICLGLALLLILAVPARNSQLDVRVTQQKLVQTLRFLNTAELEYSIQNKRYASQEELFAWLHESGKLARAPGDLSPEGLRPYELTINTIAGGTHYQITLKRPSDMHDKATWCQPAAFSDEQGVIFLGLALGCDGPGVYSAK